ncbi:GMP reductase [Vibrio rotiferianus]|nr:GMP reductase [Vibrio rotiferianus]CAH1559042.1 GMP reductase [Vibrio rotiferianus]
MYFGGGKNGGVHCKAALFMGINRHLLLFLHTLIFNQVFDFSIMLLVLTKFYGMSSKSAMDKHSGGVAGYRAAEGKTVLLPYRGSVHGTIQDILGGVRSTCTYVGAAKLKELTKRTTFIRVQEQENNVFGKE